MGVRSRPGPWMPLYPFNTCRIEDDGVSVFLHRLGEKGLLLRLKWHYADSRFELVNGLAKSL